MDKISKIKLNNVDHAWLRMDRPNNPMVITVILRFTGQINYDRLITRLEVNVRRFRRFRQRIVRPHQIFSRPYWEDVPHHQVKDHVERVKLPIPADDNALMELVSRKISTPLDFAYPLWQATLVDNYSEGSVLIIRIHHCIGDGISLMQVLLQMTQISPDEPVSQIPAGDSNLDEYQPERGPAMMQAAPQASDHSEVSPAISDAKPGEPASKPRRDTLYSNPKFTELIAATARIILRLPDPPSILKGPLGQVKKGVWSEPFALSEIKKIARYKQATSNDVLMALASGAFRRYLDLRNDNRKRNIRAFTMVNLRRRFFDEDLGNKFALVYFTLPLDREQPLECLGEVKRGLDSLKNSAESAATFRILKILGWMPEWVEHLATMFLDSKGTVVATNISGPHHQVYLAGAPIQSLIVWVPQSGRIGVGLSFVIYNNQVMVGLNADAGLVPDPEKILELFTEELKSFQAALP
jgi:diacylglycerol O-acyltransferase / wax synthase